MFLEIMLNLDANENCLHCLATEMKPPLQTIKTVSYNKKP